MFSNTYEEQLEGLINLTGRHVVRIRELGHGRVERS